MARRSKLTPDITEKVVQAIKMGATYELAAAYAGIAASTFYEYMKKPEFSEAVKGAEGAGAMIWLAKIEKAASDGNWQAAAWKLERRYPEAYGRSVQTQQVNAKHEHSGPDGSAIPIAFFDANAALARVTAGSEGDR